MKDQQVEVDPELVQKAKRGVLHLLAVRNTRHLDRRVWELDHEGQEPLPQREDMEERKIIKRLVGEDIKQHQLDFRAERNKELRIANPYAGLTEEAIRQALTELTASHSIRKLSDDVIISSPHRLDEDDTCEQAPKHAIPSGPSYAITEIGLHAVRKMPGLEPEKLIREPEKAEKPLDPRKGLISRDTARFILKHLRQDGPSGGNIERS